MVQETEDVIIDFNKDFPRIAFHPSSFKDTKDVVKLELMLSRGTNPNRFSSYNYDVYMSQEDYDHVEAIFKALPRHFIEETMIEMIRLRWRMGSYRNQDEKYYEAVKAIRLEVNKKVIAAVKDFPQEQKYKNVVLSIVRCYVGRNVDDIDGD